MGKIRDALAADLLSQTCLSHGVEWHAVCTQFVNDAAKRPDVASAVVLLPFDNFRRRIAQCPNVAVSDSFAAHHLRYLYLTSQCATYSKVPHLDVKRTALQEDVAGLKISVDDVLIMDHV